MDAGTRCILEALDAGAELVWTREGVRLWGVDCIPLALQLAGFVALRRDGLIQLMRGTADRYELSPCGRARLARERALEEREAA